MRREPGALLASIAGAALGLQALLVARTLLPDESEVFAVSNLAARDMSLTADRSNVRLPMVDPESCDIDSVCYRGENDRNAATTSLITPAHDHSAPPGSGERPLLETIEWGRPPIRELRVHAEAPPWLKEAAVKAARDWCQWGRSLCLRVRFVEDRDNVLLRPAIADHGFAGLTSWWASDEPPVILIADLKALAEGQLSAQATLAHELGHALCGCVGHPENRGVMDGRVELAAHQTIPADAAFVLHFRAKASR